MASRSQERVDSVGQGLRFALDHAFLDAVKVREHVVMASEYIFVDEWDVDAPQEAVFDALADGRTYPDWWTPTYLEAETDGPPEPGRVARHRFKGKLPYVLETTTRLTCVDRPDRVEADVDGDLRGRAMWTLTPRGSKVHVRFDFRVFADRPFLRYLTPILRPLFRWNHKQAIAYAVRNLGPYARRQAGLIRPE
jgi:uncharacterized protein YndB with AHSA1/START domain